jgi:hypothetical protein
VEHYRIANEISLKNYRGEASTEELRQAIMHYRAVFDGLLASDASKTGSTYRPRGSRIASRCGNGKLRRRYSECSGCRCARATFTALT